MIVHTRGYSSWNPHTSVDKTLLNNTDVYSLNGKAPI